MSGTVGVAVGEAEEGSGEAVDGSGLDDALGDSLTDELGEALVEGLKEGFVAPTATGAVPIPARATGVTRAAPMTHFAAGSMQVTLTCFEQSTAWGAKWSGSRSAAGE